MTHFFDRGLHQVGSDAPIFGSGATSIETRQFRVESEISSEHRHSHIRDCVFGLRPRDQFSPII